MVSKLFSQYLKKFKFKTNSKKSNLTDLAKLHNCDKWGAHFYTPHYETHFDRFKNEKIILLELGVGGYANPECGGASLRMWKDFFRNGDIFGIDIYDKTKINENRIRTFQGSQVDEKFINGLINEIGNPDIIIDDGSHLNTHIIDSFNILFPLLKTGGIYVIEDIQTSYWPDYEGDSEDLENKNTAINFFKSLIHGLNYQEILDENYNPTYFDLNIVSIHFYHNLIFIYKGKNNEPSNMVKNNKFIGN